MPTDKMEALMDQLKDRYRDYLKEKTEAELIEILKNVSLFDFKIFLIDEVLDADSSGFYDDEFQDAIGDARGNK